MSLQDQLAKAKKFLADGRPREARAALGRIEGAHPEVERILTHCLELALRKAARQRKVDEFATEAGDAPHLRLALARIADSLATAATDQLMPAPDRELAAWSIGDVRAGLQAMRARAGWRGLAEAWMLLLRDEASRALAAFEAEYGAHPQRASLGAGIASALLHDAVAAEKSLRQLGPFPAALFPAMAQVLRDVAPQSPGWDPSRVRHLLDHGSLTEVEQALKACPTSQGESRGWLLLRRGDLLPAGSPAAKKCWEDAAGMWPALRADALKRKFWLEIKQGQPNSHLHELFSHLAQVSIPDATEIGLILIDGLPTSGLAACKGPHQRCPDGKMAVEKLTGFWLLMWASCAHIFCELERNDHANGRAFAREFGIKQVPRKWLEWKPIFAVLSKSFPGNARVLDLRLQVLESCNAGGELRKALFDQVLLTPERQAELLPRWCIQAASDRRGIRQIADESEGLLKLFPGHPEVTLSYLRVCAPSAQRRAEVLALMPTEHAQMTVWCLDGGPLPRGLFGHDVELDQFGLRHNPHLDVKVTTDLLDKFKQVPGHYLNVLRALVRVGCASKALLHAMAWSEAVPTCWQAWYANGKFLEFDSYEGFTRRSNHWHQGRRLAPADTPEGAEMIAWFVQHPGMNFGSDANAAGAFDPFNGFGNPFRRRAKQTASPKAKAVPKKKVILCPLDRCAKAMLCFNELALANIPLIRAAAQEEDNGTLAIDFSGISSDEKDRAWQFVTFLQQQQALVTLLDSKSREWLKNLERALFQP